MTLRQSPCHRRFDRSTGRVSSARYRALDQKPSPGRRQRLLKERWDVEVAIVIKVVVVRGAVGTAVGTAVGNAVENAVRDEPGAAHNEVTAAVTAGASNDGSRAHSGDL